MLSFPVQVKKYFNTEGFERWRKIYGETEDVNKVQLDIRNVSYFGMLAMSLE